MREASLWEKAGRQLQKPYPQSGEMQKKLAKIWCQEPNPPPPAPGKKETPVQP